ncbi:suppressor of SWI4 1 [Biomphalaria glabrata]|uniref:Suppressor of SWI4 1 homolog isoform X2 n=1 Tax=Biomphalaria glabrata TaxID=6526 RepID=A0A9W2ZIV6_BIOGL|nr:suppressor of SWI4 1 homolog isoform X2 [Biomphalaria glabrata]KAI8766774.1 putative suppressor of SWI4 1 [Biomphalaria glabrata]
MGKKKGKKGKAARNAQAGQTGNDKEEEIYLKAPHSFVFHRGHVGRTIKDLVLDVRKIMEPYTASSLRVRKKNVMKDFLTIAGPLHVTHFIVFTKTDIATYMKLICIPRGPTLTFKINEFSLSKDTLSYQKHPDVDSTLFVNHAVLVTNIPSDSMENKLMNVTFKNLFPSINPNTVKLNNMRRAVLVNYDPESKSVDIRHYSMKVVPTGVSKAVKKLMRTKLPDLGHHQDIADLFLDKGLSDSEGEQDGPNNMVTVLQNVKDRGVTKNAVNAIRLKEIGPRLTLQLVKIEEGFEAGNILFHSLITKTPEELEALKLMRKSKEKEKLARKQKQEANIKKKLEAKEEHIKKSLEGMKKKKKLEGETEETEKVTNSDKESVADSDDDTHYYKEEVGEAPDPEMFTQSRKRKQSRSDGPTSDGPTAKQPKHNTSSKATHKTKSTNNKQSKFSLKIQHNRREKKKGFRVQKTKKINKR